MSLLATASEFNATDKKGKKRISTMNRDISNIQCVDKNIVKSISMEEDAIENENKNKRVLNLMNKLKPNNDGTNLENFEPLANPTMTYKNKDKEDDNSSEGMTAMSPSDMLPQTHKPIPSKFTPNGTHIENLSNLTETYSGKINFKVPSLTNNTNNGDKLTEKINYMIHLLEQQQAEKVDNVMEEFVLYIFLGVFVIFTVDSFTRAGRYVR